MKKSLERLLLPFKWADHLVHTKIYQPLAKYYEEERGVSPPELAAQVQLNGLFGSMGIIGIVTGIQTVDYAVSTPQQLTSTERASQFVFATAAAAAAFPFFASIVHDTKENFRTISKEKTNLAQTVYGALHQYRKPFFTALTKVTRLPLFAFGMNSIAQGLTNPFYLNALTASTVGLQVTLPLAVGTALLACASSMYLKDQEPKVPETPQVISYLKECFSNLKGYLTLPKPALVPIRNDAACPI